MGKGQPDIKINAENPSSPNENQSEENDFLETINKSELKQLGHPLYQAFQNPVFKVNKVVYDPNSSKKGNGLAKEKLGRKTLKSMGKLDIV